MEIGKTKRIIESDPIKDPVPDREPNNPLPVPEPQPTPDKEPAKVEGKWWVLDAGSYEALYEVGE